MFSFAPILATILMVLPAATAGHEHAPAVVGASTVGPFSAVEVYPGAGSALDLDLATLGLSEEGLTVTAMSVSNDARGALVVEPAGDLLDPARWISRPDPRGQPTRLLISVPNSARSGDHAVAVVAVDDGAVPVTVPILLRIPGETRALMIENEGMSVELDGSAWWPFGRTTATMQYGLVNQGSIAVVGRASVGVESLFSRTDELMAIDDLVLLPGGALRGTASGEVGAVGVAQPTVALSIFSTAVDDEGRPVVDYVRTESGDVVAAVPFVLLFGLGFVVLVITANWVVYRRRGAAATLPIYST